MGPTLTYFRLHRWQRRVLSLLVAVALGLGGAVILRPVMREYYLVRDLGSRDLAVRNAAINRAAILAREYPHVLVRLNRELAADDDVEFQAITRVLEFLGVFRVPGRDPNQLDRLRLVEFTLTRADVSAGSPLAASQTTTGATSRSATSTSSPLAASQTTATAASRAAARSAIAAETRLFLFQDAVLTGRDNVYNRRLLAAAARDDSPAIRQAACVLAARFADANTLLQLLHDHDPNVVEWAAIDAGLGRPRDLRVPDSALATSQPKGPVLDGLLRLQEAVSSLDSNDPEVISACAYAMPEFWGIYEHNRPGPYDPGYAARFTEANDPRIQARILFASGHSVPGEGLTAQAATGLAKELMQKGEYLPEWLILADKVCLTKIFDGALRDPNGPSRLQILAALDVERRHTLCGPGKMDAVLGGLWGPGNRRILVAAARALGEEIEREPNAASRATYVGTLREAAMFDAGSDPDEPDFALAVPAAAAAVAMWLREPSADSLTDANSTAYLVYHASCSEHQLAGDYIAWHLSRADGNPRAKAFQLGMNLLPPSVDPRDANTRRGFRNYSATSRATAAMLMALAARTPQEKDAAKARIASRLEGGPLRAPSDFYEVNTYKCALLILGETRYRAEVAALLDSGTFPVRRAITALCAAGDRGGLDWLLWDLRAGTPEIAEIIVGTRLCEVLSVLVPELPAVDEAAGDDLRNWQVRILQDYYRIHREKIRFAPAN